MIEWWAVEAVATASDERLADVEASGSASVRSRVSGAAGITLDEAIDAALPSMASKFSAEVGRVRSTWRKLLVGGVRGASSPDPPAIEGQTLADGWARRMRASVAAADPRDALRALDLTPQLAATTGRWRREMETDPIGLVRRLGPRELGRDEEARVIERLRAAAARGDTRASRRVERMLRQRTEALARSVRSGRARTLSTRIAHESLAAELADRGVTVRRRRWRTRGDERVRPAHVAANGQEVEGDQPFVVGGVAMDYPGDAGAPAGLIYRCRCTISVWATTPDGEEVTVETQAIDEATGRVTPGGASGTGPKRPVKPAEGLPADNETVRAQVLGRAAAWGQERGRLRNSYFADEIPREEYLRRVDEGKDALRRSIHADLLRGRPRAELELDAHTDILPEDRGKFEEAADFVGRLAGTRRKVGDISVGSYESMPERGMVGFARPDMRRIYVLRGDDLKPQTIVHEMTHLVESSDEDLLGAAVGWYRQHTRGQRARPQHYGASGRDDRLKGDDALYAGADPYEVEPGSGNVPGIDVEYRGKRVGATEVSTMGVELLYADPVRLARDNPHLFDFVVDQFLREAP